MKFEQALQQIFKRRNCGFYDASGVAWPPCTNPADMCQCVLDAREMVAQSLLSPDASDSRS